jgi:hypothetical protein
MPVRWLAFLALLGLVVAPNAARSADEKKTSGPTAIVRLKSIDDLVEDAKYLAGMAGQQEKARQFAGMLESVLRDKGGIDSKRPLGVYATISSDDLRSSHGVVMVPVTDSKPFLDILEGFNVTAEKGADDIYQVKSELLDGRVPVFLTFAHKYAYITGLNKSALAKKNLLDPAQVFPRGHDHTISVQVRLDQIPDSIKNLVLSNVELEAAKNKDKAEGTEAQRAAREKGAQLVTDQFKMLVRDGGPVEVFFDVDRQAKALVVEVNLAGKPNTKLAAAIAEIGKAPSLFAGLAGGDAALSVLVHLAMPEAMRQGIMEAIQKGLKDEKDEAKREQIEKILKAVEPTIKAGQLDTLVALRGPTADHHYTFVTGIAVKDGEAIDTVLRDAIKGLKESDKAKIKLDAETVGEVKVHQIEAQKDFDAEGRRILGENPLYLAISPKMVVVTGGPKGLDVMKEALGAASAAGPQVQVQVAMSRLASLMVKEHKNAPQVAKEVFGANEGSDQIRFRIEGGKAWKARLDVSALVLKFLSQLEHSKKGATKEDADESR